jgi:plasmid segregation protein ParM
MARYRPAARIALLPPARIGPPKSFCVSEHFGLRPVATNAACNDSCMHTELTVRAIDLGYGNVKYTRRSAEGAVEFKEFPALAVPAHSGHFDIQGIQVTHTDTIAVEAGERLFHVGPDSPVLLQGLAERQLDASYARSDRYAALMKGALGYIGEPVIDYLILGLPVSTYPREHERLIEVWTGRHTVPQPSRTGTRSVEVKRVMVVAQPVGAYMAALADGCVSKVQGNALVIDPGYFTIDWVVITSTLAIVPSRCGALHGGVSVLLRALAASLDRQLHSPIQNLTPLEAALRYGKPATLYGKKFPLEPHMDVVSARIDSLVADLVSRLGEHSDVSQVVLAGGGARLFHRALQDRFPATKVRLLDRPEYANIRGFQIIGGKLAHLARAGEATTR